MTRMAPPLIALSALLLLGANGAMAAPQVLGLVASNGAVPLQCDENGCRGDLSSFCLQQPRPNPELGQSYELADPAAVTLLGTRSNGETVRIPASSYLRFASDRGFTSVEVTLPAEVLAELDLVSVAVDVARQAALLPTQDAADPDPQSQEELDLALGAYRSQGSKFFDDTGEAGDAIRLTNLMINDLPKGLRQKTDTDGHLVDNAMRSSAAAMADPAGASLARAYHDTCVGKVDVTHHIDSMRACLEGTHDRLVGNTNVDFWKSLDGY